MRLYHFTAKHLESPIRKEGITLGVIPVSFEPPRFRFGYQWLTANRDFAQSWCARRISITYRRDDVRFDVEIPDESRSRCGKWLDNQHLTPLAGILSASGDPDSWWVFRGSIPVDWIKATTYRE